MQKTVHPINQVLGEYDVLYQQTFRAPAPIVRGKDQKLAKQLLERYSVEQLHGWLDRFFHSRDPFIRQSGYTFGVFSSCIGKLIAGGGHDDRLSGLRDFIDG